MTPKENREALILSQVMLTVSSPKMLVDERLIMQRTAMPIRGTGQKPTVALCHIPKTTGS
jgi:hypothetical protein